MTTTSTAIYHASGSTYIASLSSRKLKHRNLVLQDRRIAQYRALLKFKAVKFSSAELEALRNSAPHLECEKNSRKKLQEARCQREEEQREIKREAKESEAGLRKELDMRIGNQRMVHRDNERLLEENAILKAELVAWENENDKIMEANDVLVEELKISNEGNGQLMTSIEELSKEVEYLQKQLKNATGTFKEVAETSKKCNEALEKENMTFAKQREEMMVIDAHREVVLQHMRETTQADDARMMSFKETEKNLVMKVMMVDICEKNERIKFLVGSEQERLNQLRGMRMERDGLPQCGCVTQRCTCEEGGYKADDDMMEWIRQSGGEMNCESDSDYDAEDTSDDCESEDYESEYESDEEDSLKEDDEYADMNDELEMTNLQAEIAKREAHLANLKYNSLKNMAEWRLLAKTQQKARESKDLELKLQSLQNENDKLKADIETSREDILEKEENNSIKGIGRKSFLERVYKDPELEESLETPAKSHKPACFSPSISTLSTATFESAVEGLDWRHLSPTIIYAPCPAPSVSSSEKITTAGWLRKEENKALDATRKWWLEKEAKEKICRDEAEKNELCMGFERLRFSKDPEENRLADGNEDQKPKFEVGSQTPPTRNKRKKKNKAKKKSLPDLNAPAKPVAPFTFYMQTARLIIASDLGGLSPQDILVDTEGQKRWSEMAGSDKKLWISAYTDNLALYNARVHAHKNGFPNAANWSDLQAIQHAERNNIENPPGGQLFLVNELSKQERKMVKVRLKEQKAEFRNRIESDERGREERRAPDGTWIQR